MTELYIIAGIVGYLLIGGVVAGISMRLAGDSEWEPATWFQLLLWPLGVCMLIPIGVGLGLVWIAKKIGGVK